MSDSLAPLMVFMVLRAVCQQGSKAFRTCSRCGELGHNANCIAHKHILKRFQEIKETKNLCPVKVNQQDNEVLLDSGSAQMLISASILGPLCQADVRPVHEIVSSYFKITVGPCRPSEPINQYCCQPLEGPSGQPHSNHQSDI